MKKAENLGEFASAFDPEPLSEKYLSEFYYDGTMPIRMNGDTISPMKDLFRSCLEVRGQNAHLLLGHKGCGKSTELNMLKQKLEESGRKVSVIRCLRDADLMGLASQDLLILLGKHLCAIAEDTNCALPEPLLDAIADFWKDIEKTEVSSKERGIAAKGEASASSPKLLLIAKFFIGLSSELRYGVVKRTTVREKVERNTAQWIGYLEELSAHLTEHLGGKQPIIIFEDLDKLPPDKAWGLFDNPLSKMSFPVIYTFPISLSYAPKFAGLEAAFNNNVHFLPMIKIRTPGGEPYGAGIDTIKRIIEKRADISLFEDAALEHLIEKTGGILRDLFNCITQAARRSADRQAAKVEGEDVQSALTQLRSSLTRRIESSNYPLLKNINRGGKYKNRIENREMLLDMMQGLIVLEYNGDRWHDLHPLVEDFLKEQGELE